MKSSGGKVPKHIGIILDGNRRLAKRLMMKPWKGHEWGAKKVEKLLDWAYDLDVKELTIYSLSLENFNRPKNEFNYLMRLFKQEARRLLEDERIHKRGLRVNFIGRLWMLPEELQKLIVKIMEKTKSHKNFTVNFAVAYGGRQEVVDAVRKIAEKIKEGELDINQINEETFSDSLYLKSEPDLIIRTGGEKRTSNFLNFQSAYSEYIFLKKCWPEFEKEDLISAVEEFGRRERRRGR